MDDSQFAKEWEQTRSRGFARFVVNQGATWGVSVALVVSFGEWSANGTVDLLHGLAVLAACIAIGCVFAPLTWHKREARYKYFLEHASDQ